MGTRAREPTGKGAGQKVDEGKTSAGTGRLDEKQVEESVKRREGTNRLRVAPITIANINGNGNSWSVVATGIAALECCRKGEYFGSDETST